MKTQQTKIKTEEFQRGTREWKNETFKLLPAEGFRNKSWKHLNVDLEKVTHNHIFHSHDRSGRPNQYCAPCQGHFHEITWDPEQKVFVCGPALIKTQRQVRGTNRVITNVVQRKFRQQTESIDEDDKLVIKNIVDNHTHEGEYMGYNMVSQATMGGIRSHNKQNVDAYVTDATKVATQAVNAQNLAKGEYSNSKIPGVVENREGVNHATGSGDRGQKTDQSPSEK